jgi:glycosyltransferase involved in cell wall biosynthesis
MHIALVTPYLPWPADTGGRVRTARFVRSLARLGEIQLFSVVAPEDRESEAQLAGRGLEPFYRVVTHAEQDPGRATPREGPERSRRFPDALVRALAASHRARRFDVVVLAHCHCGRALAALEGKAPVVLDEHDVESHVQQQLLAGAHAASLPGRLIELWRWRRFEQAVWTRVDAITVVRADDAARIRVVRPDTGVVVPNGVDSQGHPYRSPSSRLGSTVLFAGAMSHPTNVRAARLLAEQVMPRVRARVRDATLTIAGRAPTPAVLGLEGDHVRVTGTLASLAPLLADHAVFCVPPDPRGRHSLRLLEPMACGMPVVCPPEAVRDLPAVAGAHFVPGGSVEEIADAVASVLLRRESFDAMAAAASRLADQFDWAEMGERFARTVLSAVERRRT